MLQQVTFSKLNHGIIFKKTKPFKNDFKSYLDKLKENNKRIHGYLRELIQSSVNIQLHYYHKCNFFCFNIDFKENGKKITELKFIPHAKSFSFANIEPIYKFDHLSFMVDDKELAWGGQWNNNTFKPTKIQLKDAKIN